MTYKFWSVLLATTIAIFSAGCGDVPMGNDNNRPDLVGEAVDQIAEFAGVGAPAVETSYIESRPSLPPFTCKKDERGNGYKVIGSSQGATLASESGLIRTVPMMEKLYLFGSTDTHHMAGDDPRGRVEGQIAQESCFVTSNMQWVRFCHESASFRKPVVGYASRAEVERVLNGETVTPSLTEEALGGDLAWMPILSSEERSIGRTTKVRLLELGAWTLRDDSAIVLQQPIPDHLKKVSLVIVVDATSSMNPAWKAIREQLNKIVSSCFDGNLVCEIAIVAYRDTDSSSVWSVRNSKFSSDLEKVRGWTSSIKPKGGGDWEERMFEAIKLAVDMLDQKDKRQSYKSILVVADNAGKVDESTEDVLGTIGRHALDRCVENGISISTLQCGYHERFNGDKNRLNTQFSAMTSATFGTSIDLNAEPSNDSETVSIEARFHESFHRTALQVYEELEIAEEMASGKNPEEIAKSMDLPASALTWRIKNIERRSDHGRLEIGDHRTLGLDRVWVICDPNAMETGVLLRKDELKILQSTVSELLDKGAEKAESLVPLFESIAGGYIGDEDITISDALRVQGIPVRTNLLSHTCTEMVLMSRLQRLALAEEIEHRFDKLTEYAQRHPADKNGNFIIPISIMP